jgi:hypothetical protein
VRYANSKRLLERGTDLSQYVTRFGSLLDYRKGTVDIVDDDPRHYAFSNIFDVAANSKAYERVAVAQNMDYVLEAIRAEGTSRWHGAAHDEFALVMDGEVEVRLVKLDTMARVPVGTRGSVWIEGEPKGRRMGRIVAGRGHMALLPANCAYQFHAERPSVMLMQTIAGEATIYRWAEICTTA